MAQNRLPQPEEYEHLGSYLRDLRLYFALDVAEVARRTHIRAKYIQAIEDQQLEALPGKVYARGYVVTYAEFFGLAAEDFATRYMAQFGATGTIAQREQAYFVPEPKRQQIAKQSSRSWLYLLGVLAVAAGGAYLVMQDAQEAPLSDVMEVPESLVEQLRNGMMPVARNVECLTGVGRLSCLTAGKPMVLPGYVQAPQIFYVERETSLPDEGAETEASLMESEDAAEASEEKTEDAPVAKPAAKPAEKTEKPKAPEKKPDAPSAPAVKKEETKTQAKPEAAKLETKAELAKTADAMPFKRQGEEDAPANVADATKPKAADAGQPPAVAEVKEVAEEKQGRASLLPKWLVSESDAPQGYQDPNAPPEDEWTPRRRR